VTLLRSKAEALEMVVVGMLKDLMQGSALVIESAAASTTKLCDDTEAHITDGIEQLTAIQKDVHQSIVTHVETVTHNAQEARTVTVADLDTLRDMNDKTNASLATSSENTTHKHNDLDTTVTKLLTEIDTALSEGRQIIAKTSETSEGLVNELNNATQKLKGANSQSFQSFVGEMNNGCEEMLKVLKEHFEMVELSSETQKGTVNTLQTNATEHREYLQASVICGRSDTPVRHPPRRTVETLCKTRSHQQIKAERKEMLLKKLEEHLLLLQQQSVAQTTIAVDGVSIVTTELPTLGDGSAFSSPTTTAPPNTISSVRSDDCYHSPVATGEHAAL